MIGTTGTLGAALAATMAVPSGGGFALAGFFVGGTLGGALGALAVALLRRDFGFAPVACRPPGSAR